MLKNLVHSCSFSCCQRERYHTKDIRTSALLLITCGQCDNKNLPWWEKKAIHIHHLQLIFKMISWKIVHILSRMLIPFTDIFRVYYKSFFFWDTDHISVKIGRRYKWSHTQFHDILKRMNITSSVSNITYPQISQPHCLSFNILLLFSCWLQTACLLPTFPWVRCTQFFTVAHPYTIQISCASANHIFILSSLTLLNSGTAFLPLYFLLFMT